ncbi:MAG: hypothetical protein V3R99_04605 [Thermoguttaceae bacterium]
MRQPMIGGSLLVFVAISAGAYGVPLGVEEPIGPEISPRYGVDADLKRYPQSDPQQAIRSIIKTIVAGDVEYMLAHLISPTQVDEKLAGSQKAFAKLAVKPSDKKAKALSDSLKRQLSDGTWTIRRHLAWTKADGVPDLSMEKIANRWFMHNTPVPQPSN